MWGVLEWAFVFWGAQGSRFLIACQARETKDGAIVRSGVRLASSKHVASHDRLSEVDPFP
jgi:hypothetical protein